MAHSSRRNRVLARLGAVAAGSLLALVLLEVGLRVLAPQPKSWLDVYTSLPAPLYYGLAPGASAFVDTGESAWEVHVDALGHRVAGPDAPRPQGPWCAVIGDSFTFGQGATHADSFVGLLNAGGARPVSFLNAGVGGYGPLQYRGVLDQLLEREPPPSAVIVVSFLGNDFQDCIWSKQTPVRNGVLGDTGGFRSWVKKTSHAYRFASKVVHVLWPRGQTYATGELFLPESWKQPFLRGAAAKFRAAFEAMGRACADRSIPLLVVLIPPRESVAGAESSEPEIDRDLPVATARRLLDELGLPFVDSTEALVQLGAGEAFLEVDGHLTPAGNRVLRDLIVEATSALATWP